MVELVWLKAKLKNSGEKRERERKRAGACELHESVGESFDLISKIIR